MKRLAVIVLLLLLLTGCSLAPDEYLYVAPHVDSSSQSSTSDAVTVENYLSLKNAILSMVRSGQTEGVIRASSYDGEVEEDLAEAAYEVSKLDPLGAYAVDYMTHSCTQIVSYYEIRINITFRRTAQEISEIRSVSTASQLEERLKQAINQSDDRLTLRLTSYRDQDQEVPAIVAEYCASDPATVIEIPDYSISIYPESGTIRIMEIDFTYANQPEVLQGMREAVQESINGAAEYIRYRETDRDKTKLLFIYLMERFRYTAGETNTPLYDALCSGVADPTGLAQAWQLICDRAGVECYTVSGMRDGDPYTWNIVRIDNSYRHVDLARCALDLNQLVFWTDADMTEYYWNTELLPACEPLPEVVETPEETEETPEEPETEETPETVPETEPTPNPDQDTPEEAPAEQT